MPMCCSAAVIDNDNGVFGQMRKGMFHTLRRHQNTSLVVFESTYSMVRGPPELEGGRGAVQCAQIYWDTLTNGN